MSLTEPSGSPALQPIWVCQNHGPWDDATRRSHEPVGAQTLTKLLRGGHSSSRSSADRAFTVRGNGPSIGPWVSTTIGRSAAAGAASVSP